MPGKHGVAASSIGLTGVDYKDSEAVKKSVDIVKVETNINKLIEGE